jgi:lipopolysaccharide export system permease protein
MQERSIGAEGMWVRTSSGIINIKRMDLDNNRLQGVTAYHIDRPFQMRERVNARVLEWHDGRWFTDKASFRAFGAGAEAGMNTDGGYTLEGLAGPEDLVNIENLHKNMGFMELRQYIKGLEEDGYETTRYRIDLYGKLAFPFVNFVMVLVGIPFALKTGRYSGIATGLGLSVAIAFSYWVVFAVTRSLGQGGVIPPLVASAFPDVIFLAVGALMIGYVRE